MSSARSIGILTVLNIAGAVLALVSSVVTAHFFGTSRALEIFFAASTLETLMVSLSQSGQLNEVLIPVYHRLKHAEGLESAQRAYSVVTNWMMIWLFILASIMWLLAPWLARLLVPGFGAGDQAATAAVFRWLVPLLPLQVLLSLQQGVSNAEKWFGKPEWFGLLSQAFGILVVLLLAGRLGTWVLVVSLWANILLLLGGYLYLLRRLGYRHRFVLRHPSCPILPLFGQLGTTLGYVLSTQLYSFTLNAGMSFLPQGAFAVFKYVQRLYAKTNGILLRPVSTVFFTHFSEALAAGSEKVRALLQLALSRTLTMSALAMVVTCVGAGDTVRALWGGRLFQADQLVLAGNLLILYMALLVCSGFAQVVRKLVVSAGWITRLYVALAVTQVMCAALAWWAPKHFGIPGTAIMLVVNSTSAAAACALMLYLARPELSAFFTWSEIWRWTVASVLAWGLATLCLYGITPHLPAGRLGLGFAAAIGCTLALGLALGIAWWLQIEDVKRLASLIQTRLRPAKLNQLAV